MMMPLRRLIPFNPLLHPFLRSPLFSFLSFDHSSTTLSVNPKPKFNAVHADESSNLCTDRRAGVVLHAAACTCTLWRLYGEQTQREAARPDRARAWSRDNPVMDVPRQSVSPASQAARHVGVFTQTEAVWRRQEDRPIACDVCG